MGSKFGLLPWIHEVLRTLAFDTALDAFSGSGCVSYLLKSMGKEVLANDFLNFPATIARAVIENSSERLSPETVVLLLEYDRRHPRFIESRFRGIFFAEADLRFLDNVSWNLRKLRDPYRRDLALSALIRACVKRQPRGVFTVAGDPDRYKDGRRDLRLSLSEQFVEQVEAYNRAVFDNGRENRVSRADVFDSPTGTDLVYMDPPYVPRADDNCYVKRYHFLEGLSCYWQGVRILEKTRVQKIAKPYTPFSYRKNATDAFERMFSRYRESILVLSYSSNGFPDLGVLVATMKRFKKSVVVHEHPHRYRFGTHGRVAARRAVAQEYLIVGA